MKVAIVIFVIGDKYKEIFNCIFRKNVELYCKKYDYDLIILDKLIRNEENMDKKKFYWQRLLIPSNFKGYDYVVSLDSDIYINSNSPPFPFNKISIGKANWITVLQLFYDKFNPIVEKLNNNEYTFIVDRTYPFHSPRFYFNNKPYSYYLKLPSQKFSEYLKKFTNKSCLCCSSLCCKFNWSPAIKLRMFIEELNRIRQHKRNIVYKILAIQIKDKYLIDDVDLDSFLFP
jgi:hypothetical protein